MQCLLLLVLLVLSCSVAAQDANQGAANALYERALDQIETKHYSDALASLRFLQKRYPKFKKIAAVQTRIAVLQESADAGESLAVFLRALALRDSGEIDRALIELATIASAYPAGALTDDALYITAYLQVMDRYDFHAARTALGTLNQRFPASAYSDSALYLDAIALEQLGETQAARVALMDLRDRHTALSLPLNFRWPSGSVLSRYWFDRADRRLAIVKQRIASASQLGSKEERIDGKLRVAVNVDGADMQLLLVPSPLTRQTQWLDGQLSDQLPPSIGVFDGTVEGVPNSWVRAVLQEDSISGVVNIDGNRHKLQPANLIGTLDYYQPRSRKPVSAGGLQSDLANSLQGLDMLIAPPEEGAVKITPRSRTVHTDIRAVPVSIVVDSQYDRYYAGGGLAEALNNLNIADGVYRQFGLALTLDEALSFREGEDPMQLGAVTLETILRSFRDYRLQYKTLFQDSALTYLFTGNPKTDVTLGLAWIDTACRLDGYDVGVTTPSTFGDVLLTHELGHSLGAQHDSDTQCNDNPRSLMWPNISSRTEASFTSCSTESVLRSRAKSCLKNSVDLVLEAYSDSAIVVYDVVNSDGALTLDAQLVVETSAPDQLIWPAGCQVQTPTSATCFVDTLNPAERRSLHFQISEPFQGSNAPVTAQLSPVGLLELRPDNNLATASLAGGVTQDHLPVSAPASSLGEVPGAGSSNSSSELAAAKSGTGSVSASLLFFGALVAALRLLFQLPWRGGFQPGRSS
ncbi:MAG: M12 family metallo-peptidase [Granulosicoccus sp.]